MTIITVEMYSVQNVLKDTIKVRNSCVFGQSASFACDVKGVREKKLRLCNVLLSPSTPSQPGHSSKHSAPCEVTFRYVTRSFSLGFQ